MAIDLEKISELVKLFTESSAEEMEVKKGDNKVILKGPAQKKETTSSSKQSEPELVTIESDRVGKFFRGTRSEDSPWVKEGEIVEPGNRLGYIKTLRTTHKIKAEQKGQIVDFEVEHKEDVEYGEKLLTIRPFSSKDEA